MTFRDQYRDFQEIVRELYLLRGHNEKFKAAQASLLLISEGSLTMLALERFLRMFTGNFQNKQTLPNLLEKATSMGLRLGAKEQGNAIAAVRDVRNAIVHGNFEQAATDNGVRSAEVYFGKYFAGEVEFVFRLLETLVAQVDPITGKLRAAQ